MNKCYKKEWMNGWKDERKERQKQTNKERKGGNEGETGGRGKEGENEGIRREGENETCETCILWHLGKTVHAAHNNFAVFKEALATLNHGGIRPSQGMAFISRDQLMYLPHVHGQAWCPLRTPVSHSQSSGLRWSGIYCTHKPRSPCTTEEQEEEQIMEITESIVHEPWWVQFPTQILLLLFWKNYLCTRLVSTFWGWNSNLTRWWWILLSFFPAFTVHSRTSIGPEKWAEYPRPFPVRKLCRNSKQDQTCISQWVCIQVRPGTLFQG